jgi:hypothetical protein
LEFDKKAFNVAWIYQTGLKNYSGQTSLANMCFILPTDWQNHNKTIIIVNRRGNELMM